MRVLLLFLSSFPLWLNATTPPQARNLFAHLPLRFEDNTDQADGDVKYIVRGDGYSADLKPNGIVFALKKPIRITFIAANRHAVMEPLDPLRGVSNYYLGDDPDKWRVKIPSYRRVKGNKGYPGIDFLFYCNKTWVEEDL